MDPTVKKQPPLNSFNKPCHVFKEPSKSLPCADGRLGRPDKTAGPFAICTKTYSKSLEHISLTTRLKNMMSYAATLRNVPRMVSRSMSSVAVLGAAGGIGQPLSLLIKREKRLSKAIEAQWLGKIRW